MDISPEGYKFLVAYLGLKPWSKRDRFTTFEKPLLKKLDKLPEGSPERVILEGMLEDIRSKADSEDYTADADLEKLARAVERAVQDRKDGKGSTDFVIELQSASMPEEIRKSLKEGEAMGLVKVAMVQCATAFAGPEKAIALLKAKMKIESGGLEFDAPFRLTGELEDLKAASGTALFVDFRGTAQLHATLVKDKSSQASSVLDMLAKALTAHVKAIETKCRTLVDTITATMKDKGRLGAAIDQVKDDNAAIARRAQWATHRAAADEVIRQLEWWAEPAAGGLRGRLSGLTEPEGDEEGDKEAIDEAAALLKDAKKQAAATRGAFDKGKEKILADLQKLEPQLKAINLEYQLDISGMGGIGDSGVMKLNLELLDKCESEAKAIRSILDDGANMGSLAAARDLLASITTSLNQRSDALTSGKADDLTALIDACDRRLAHPYAKKYMPKRLADAQKTYDEVAAKAIGKPVDKQVAEYQKVKDSLDALVKDAESRRDKLKTFEKSKKSAHEALKKIAKGLENEGPKDKPGSDDKDFYKKYHGALASELSGAVELVQAESLPEVDKAVTMIAKVVADCAKILTAMKTKKEDRTADQTKTVMQAIEGQIVGISEKKQREKDAADFKEAHAEFEEAVANALFEAEGKPEIMNEIRGYGTMGKTAKDMFQSQHDLAQAKSVLDKGRQSIKVALRKLKVRPTDLARIADDWAKACGTLDAQLTKLAEAAVAAVDELPDDSDLKEAAGKVERQLLDAAKPFRSAPGFDKAQKIYAKDGVGPSELKVAREAVLQQVRLLLERLSNDPVIRAAQANPFGRANVVAPLYARLRSIELKALVTV